METSYTLTIKKSASDNEMKKDKLNTCFLKGMLCFFLLNGRSNMNNSTYCTHSLALPQRQAGGSANRFAKTCHFLCHWAAWNPKGRYSLFEKEVKRKSHGREEAGT